MWSTAFTLSLPPLTTNSLLCDPLKPSHFRFLSTMWLMRPHRLHKQHIGDDGVDRNVRADPNVINPLGVGVAILDGVLALSMGVPELNDAVLRGECGLSIINREGDGWDILGVADEAASSGAS
ncbi:hypothetical protein U1Q18_033695 [Sarracenia purpurea var. burkii]